MEYIYLILKTIFVLIVLIVYAKLLNIKEINNINIIDFICLNLIIFLSAILLANNISLTNYIIIAIINFTINLIYKYLLFDKIIINYNKNRYVINNDEKDIYEILNNMKLKTLKNILSKYDL